MTDKFYYRPTEELIREALEDTPVVINCGPRQVGKSTLVKGLRPDTSYFTLDDLNLLNFAKEDPQGFIESLPDYSIIDEVQRAPNLVLAIKESVDRDRRPGRFLITGSANLALMQQVQESLAGRNDPTILFPLTATELSQTTKKKGFVDALLNGEVKPKLAAYPDTLERLKAFVCRGGYPEPLTRSVKRSQRWFNIYVNDIITRDAKEVDNIDNTDALISLFKICAHRTASLLESSSMAKEVQLSLNTTKKYIETLEKLFLIRRLPAWTKNPAKRMIKSPKIHVIDSGIACAMSHLSEENWMSHADYFGNLIESFAVQQIIAQLQWLDSNIKVYHYRDQNKNEVDIVIDDGSSIWGVEIKRAKTISNDDFKGLVSLSKDASKIWKGGVVLYSGEHVVKTSHDNIYAVPFGALWEGI